VSSATPPPVAPDSHSDTDLHLRTDDLQAEQVHLDESRAALARMRARTESLDSAAAGDWVSREYLESAFAARRKALADDPNVPLFFGRVDYLPDAPDVGGESFHVGRRHISDEVGDPMVVDWRAPVSRAFYRASQAEPLGLRMRRRYGFVRGRLTGYEDESLLPDTGVAEYSALLEAEIERPRVGPMRDIVATIQPEQDVIVRADLERSVCVQGAPGTGKTAVGLHRAAYLLYAHRDQLSRQGVLVVGPNASFLRYIGDVLPALGEMAVGQTTIEELVATTLRHANAKATIRGTDPAPVATLKGDARMAEVLSRAVWSQLRTPQEALVVPRGAARWRVPAYEVEETIAVLRGREVRYGAARAMLAQRLAHAVLVKMESAGDSPDDRVQDAVARSRPVRQYVDAIWPAVDPARLVVRLLSDADFLAAAADGILEPDEQQRLLWPKPAKAPGSAPWSLADAVLVDEASDQVSRQPSLGHVVLDEAQDLSALMLRAVGRRCTTGSATVLGDLAQTTTAWGVGSWAVALAHLGKPDAVVDELTRGFRVPGEVIEYAAGVGATHSRRARDPVRRPPGGPRRHRRPRPRARRLGGPDRARRSGRRRRACARRPAVRGRRHLRPRRGRVRRPARRRPGVPGEGSRVRPRRAPRAGGDRGRGAGRGHRPAPALRLPDSCGHLARRAARASASRSAGRLTGPAAQSTGTPSARWWASSSSIRQART
jgi:hypothetical protein